MRNSFLFLLFALIFSVSSRSQEISLEVQNLFRNNPIFDALQEPFYLGSGMPLNFVQIHNDTGIKGMTGKLSGTQNGFDSHATKYQDLRRRGDVNFTATSRSLSCKYNNDNKLEFSVYQQKPWPIEYVGSDIIDKARIIAEAARWASQGLRILQLEYSERSNGEYYKPGEQFAGIHRAIRNHLTCSCPTGTPICQSRTGGATYYDCVCENGRRARGCDFVDNENRDPGLTKYRRWMAEALLEQGVILDVSHSRDQTVIDVVKVARDLAIKKGRPVPVLITHANLDHPLFKESVRNKSVDEICEVASTGGFIGVMPIKNFLPDNVDFFHLAEQIKFIKNIKCGVKSWDGKEIQMINHVAVATDSQVDYTDDEDFYLDIFAKNKQRWKILATYMRKDNDNDGRPDFTQTEIKKIFGKNVINSIVLGLRGQLPFDSNFCEIPEEGNIYTGDFSGDGRSDLLYHTIQGRSYINFSQKGGHFNKVNWSRDNARGRNIDRNWCRTNSKRKLFIGDFNGDGRDDLLCQNFKGQTYIDFAAADGTFSGTNWDRMSDSENGTDRNWCSLSSKNKLYIGDFNGDGRDDLLCHTTEGSSYIDYADSAGRFRGTNWSRLATKKWCKTSATQKLLVGDYNGDGKADLLCHNSSGLSFIDYASSRGEFDCNDWMSTTPWCRISSKLRIYAGDVTGDGKTDLFCHSKENGKVWTSHANLLGQFMSTSRFFSYSFCKKANEKVLISDVNADNKTDMLCFSDTEGYLSMLVTNGDKLLEKE